MMVKKSGNIKAIMIAVMMGVLYTIGCGSGESKNDKETTETYNETKEESTTMFLDIEEESTDETMTIVDNETSVEETTTEETTAESILHETVSTEINQETTTFFEDQYTETTTEYVFVEDGHHIWQYRSDIYPDDSEKGRLEEVFWNQYGWTAFGKDKNDQMVTSIVELVSDIMNTYSNDFERERALYEAICLSCDYDYESLETGLTNEGQSVYGVLVEHKAVCGGYSSTFGIGLSMMGIENELVVGMASNGMHGWNKVCLDGEWYEVDVTWGDGIDDGFNYAYFNLTTDEMSRDHERRGRECTGTMYNEEYLRNQYIPVFLKENKYIESVDGAVQYIREQLQAENDEIVFYMPEETAETMWNMLNNKELPMSGGEWEIYNYIEITKRITRYKHVCLNGIFEFVLDYRE